MEFVRQSMYKNNSFWIKSSILQITISVKITFYEIPALHQEQNSAESTWLYFDKCKRMKLYESRFFKLLLDYKNNTFM